MEKWAIIPSCWFSFVRAANYHPFISVFILMQHTEKPIRNDAQAFKYFIDFEIFDELCMIVSVGIHCCNTFSFWRKTESNIELLLIFVYILHTNCTFLKLHDTLSFFQDEIFFSSQNPFFLHNQTNFWLFFIKWFIFFCTPLRLKV